MRVGIGYDLHRLVPNRKLILGGVEIPHTLGLLGHSDADVLTHAIIDAILGAAALGDIGSHFPDSDPAYEGINSLILLREVKTKVENVGYIVQNVDSTIVAQQPKLASHITEMRGRLAETLNLSPNEVNVKATTSEGIGVVGEEEAIVAQAVVCLVEHWDQLVGQRR
ncbi:MAG: 2-C-methyl-D-erythritol 2,4-cyclodiphosphate synthase [Candidatus Poribacteria bacterium]|nr:2-C-methyl-D-erythritol 2,4-cyclodiphosphate synthase [Candidatus Poribacteria bacterium]MDE0503373.1 2-C-methyl-D-erythritol 2,4-cyclodiphosphate synthase [Candidatus Poribacteria bacterium]